MILQALVDYYNRKVEDPESGIAPLGWEWKAIPFLIDLTEDGDFVRIEDTRSGKKTKKFLVPTLGESKGNGIKANFPWENAEYVFGIPTKEDKNNTVLQKHEKFINRFKEYENQPWARAILNFLKHVDVKNIAQKFKSEWAQILKTANVLFSINGIPVSDTKEFKSSYRRVESQDKCVCLVTGKREPLKEKEPSISGSGFIKSNPTQKIQKELHIVSFNEEAFTSYGKKQGANSPIGETASFAYTTALNRLLAEDSKQKLLVGDATTVFWSGENEQFESEASGFLVQTDDPDQYVQNVKSFLESPRSGVGSFFEDSTKFYVLGMSPNSARIAIRFWHVGTISEMSQRFREYFDDLLICHRANEKEHLSIQALLLSTVSRGDKDNVSPVLAGNFMRSILEGLPFPTDLLSAVLLRIRADQARKNKQTGMSVECVSYPRAKLIKAFLNRSLRFSNPKKERMITMSLDLENDNVGYCLGRLFATLEKIQTKANPKINATIRDRFYGAASCTPVTVFGNLMRLKNHHLEKLTDSSKKYFETELEGIVGKIEEFPAHLSLNDQGRFAIGYYHQRQFFFTSKTGKTTEQV